MLLLIILLFCSLVSAGAGSFQGKRLAKTPISSTGANYCLAVSATNVILSQCYSTVLNQNTLFGQDSAGLYYKYGGYVGPQQQLAISAVTTTGPAPMTLLSDGTIRNSKGCIVVLSYTPRFYSNSELTAASKTCTVFKFF